MAPMGMDGPTHLLPIGPPHELPLVVARPRPFQKLRLYEQLRVSRDERKYAAAQTLPPLTSNDHHCEEAFGAAGPRGRLHGRRFCPGTESVGAGAQLGHSPIREEAAHRSPHI